VVGFSATLVRYCILYGTLYAGFGVQSPFLPALFHAHGLRAEEIGLVLGLGTAIRLVAGPCANSRADRLDASRSILAACAAGAAVTALFYLPAYTFWALLAAALLQAALLAPLTTLTDALALGASTARDEAARGGFEYGWVRGTGSAAFIAGLIMSGQAVAAVGIASIVWLNAGLLVSAAMAGLAVPKHTRTIPATGGPQASPWDLLRLKRFRQILVIAALVLGSHAMHDSFAVIRWTTAGMSAKTAGLIWSESVAAEVLVFLLIGPRIIDRLGSSRALVLAAAAGMLRWVVMALTAAPLAMALVEPMHGFTFALLHLACMGVLAQIVPPRLAATAQALYGTVAIGLATAVLTVVSGALYARFGAGAFGMMAGLCALGMVSALLLRDQQRS
jgi:MFS transporter, PPP family, 3-phenylpropionic acid transporter